MQTTNSELVSAILDGNVHRYGEVVQQFDQMVRSAVAWRVSDPGTIDDLVQETFYKAFKNLERLENANRLGPWLVSIARNSVNDYLRKTKLLQTQQTHVENNPGETSDPCNWVWDEVDELSTAQTVVLNLRYRLSLTYDEIAQRLNLPLSTVRGRIFEARKALKKRLQDKGLFP